jgi:DNA-binding GntR family transcriptional regulator
MRSPSLAEIVESLGDRSDFYIAGAPRPVFSPGLIEAHAEHERVIDAIASGDERLARATMEAHIRATERRLMQRLTGDDKETQETSVPAQAAAPRSRKPPAQPATKSKSARRSAR